MITYEDILRSQEIRTYINKADASLLAMGYTEHSFAHVKKCAEVASEILKIMGYGDREAELASIAGYMHDIGNVINRADHAQSGAMMAFRLLDKMGMEAGEVAEIVTAIGNHDENTAFPVNPIAAALILADKTDVRRSRVRNSETISFDIHDRVNFAVVQSDVKIDREAGTIALILRIDTAICPVMDYFEIFLTRMMLCCKAAEFFKLKFHLNINDSIML